MAASRCLAVARHARNPTVIWGAAAMGHPWPSAAKPASCRFTPQIPVELRPSCLTGRFQIKIKSADQKTADFASEKDVRARTTATATATAKPYSVKGGSWLACDADTSVHQVHRVDAIAGKPAPTFHRVWLCCCCCCCSGPYILFSRAGPRMAHRGDPPNHWRIAGMPSHSEAPSVGAKTFWLLLCLYKSDPPSGRNPK